MIRPGIAVMVFTVFAGIIKAEEKAALTIMPTAPGELICSSD